MKHSDYKIVFLFSGQGSQYRGMGEKLFESNRAFAESLVESDAFVKSQIGLSIIDEVYKNKDRSFDELLITHPAIVAIEIAMLDLMKDLNISPDYIAGTSLGEFSAGVASSVWTREMALEASIEQAKSIVQSGVSGGMLAVINEPKYNIEDLLSDNDLYVASENFPGHFTVSGKNDHLDLFQEQLDQMKISYMRLPVAHPFHCPLIEEAKTGFEYYTHMAPAISGPSKRFISGLFNKQKDSLPVDYFWRAIREQTDYISLVNYMEDKGPCLYLDLGPSGTSANFVKYNLSFKSKSLTHSIMSPYRREPRQLQKLLDLVKA